MISSTMQHGEQNYQNRLGGNGNLWQIVLSINDNFNPLFFELSS